MSVIKDLEKDLVNIYKSCGYEIDEVVLALSNRPDLGEYQLNDAMKLAKIYHKSPIVIAQDIVEKLNDDDRFINVNIAGAGFINISLSAKFLTEYVNKIKDDVLVNADKKSNKKYRSPIPNPHINFLLFFSFPIINPAANVDST